MEAAQELARRGVSRDEIWQSTGWFNDVDGNWKFEIDDSAGQCTRQIPPANPKDVARCGAARFRQYGKENSEAYKNPKSPEHRSY